MILEFRINILLLENCLIITSFKSSFEYEVRWNIKNLKGVIWGRVDKKIKYFKFLRSLLFYRFCIHSCPKVIFGHFQP
jgi:hypothetical protein